MEKIKERSKEREEEWMKRTKEMVEKLKSEMQNSEKEAEEYKAQLHFLQKQIQESSNSKIQQLQIQIQTLQRIFKLSYYYYYQPSYIIILS